MARGKTAAPKAKVERGGVADDAKAKAIELAVSSIEKQFGKGAIPKMTDDGVNHEIPSFSSGGTESRHRPGHRGLSRAAASSRSTGPESSGKTTLDAARDRRGAEDRAASAAFIDAEHALDVNYARRLGVDVDELLVSQPDTGEQALEIADVLLRSGAIDMVVVDSVAALVPRAEIEGEMGDSHVGLQARLMSQALRKLTGYGLEVGRRRSSSSTRSG